MRNNASLFGVRFNKVFCLAVGLLAGSLLWGDTWTADDDRVRTPADATDLAVARQAIVDLVALTGDRVVGQDIGPTMGEETLLVGGAGGSVVSEQPLAEDEASENVPDNETETAETASARIQVNAASIMSMTKTASSVMTINKLRGDICLDISAVYESGSPSHWMCGATSGTLTSSMKAADAVSITFEVAAGGSWLTLKTPQTDSDGYRTVAYRAASNANGKSRYGIIKCRERYYSGDNLVELCTWYPIGQCGDYAYKSDGGVWGRNYSVLCYDWAADSGNGTGIKYTTITGSDEAIARDTIYHETTDKKMVYVKTNKSAKQLEYYYYANMASDVKMCQTTMKVKGYSGKLRCWNFVAPKPTEALDAPAWFDATDNLVTNVLCTWGAVAEATSYKVFRNGILMGTTTDTSFRDVTGVVGKRYTYSVVAEAAEYGIAYATSSSVSDKGESVPLTLVSIAITPYPSSVCAGLTYAKALGCVAKFNDGNSSKVKPTWTVSGKASVNSSGTLRVSAGASGTLKVTAVYAFGEVTKKKSVSIPVVQRPEPDPKVLLSKLSIVGPASLLSGATTNYQAVATYTDGSRAVVNASWGQLTGTSWASLSNQVSYAELFARQVSSRKGVLFGAAYGGLVAKKRVEILPLATPEGDPEPKPEIAAYGDTTAVVGVSYTLPLYIDSGTKATVKVTGLPSGLKYSSSKIYGVPTKTGTYTVKISASNVAGKAKTKSFKLTVLAFPSWAVATYEGIASWDLSTAASGQACAFAAGKATVTSSGGVSVSMPFTDDKETFSAKCFSSATVSNGKVVSLTVEGQLKTSTGSYPAIGIVTANTFEFGITTAAQTARVPYAKMYRRLSSSSSSDAKRIKKVAGKSGMTYSLTSPKMTLKIKTSGSASISGKTTGKRSVSGSAKVLSKDGTPYLFFVFPPTEKGGDGFYIQFEYNGSNLSFGSAEF